MVIREDGMKKIYQIKTWWYVFFILLTNVLFPMVFNLCASFYDVKFSELDAIQITFYEIRNNFLINLLLYALILISFFIQSHGKKYFELIFKAMVAMNFINPLFVFVNYCLNNLLVNFALVIYDFIFIKVFVRTNISGEDLPEPKQKGCLVAAYLISYFLFLYWYIKL